MGVALTLLLVVVAMIPLYSSFKLKEEKKKLKVFSRITGRLIEQSVVSAMLEQNSGRLDQQLADIKKSADVIGDIWLLNVDGIVKSATDSAALGRKWDKGEDDYLLGREHGEMLSLDKGNTYRLVKPVQNKAACGRCHGAEPKYNGSIVIDFSLDSVTRQIRREIAGAAVIMLMGLFLTGAGILVLWNILVTRRIRPLVQNMGLLGEGNYEFRAVPEHADEFTRLESDFHAMAGAIRARDGEKEKFIRQTQEQLQFLQTLMDTIPMPVFYKDKDGKYQGCNRAFESVFGTPKETIIGKSVYDIAPGELADEYFRQDRELLENPGIQVYEHSVKHADGTHHDVIFNKATFADAAGNVAGLLGVMQDITKRKSAEEALRKTYHTLETLVNASPIAILVLNPGGKITLWNPAAESIFGWTAGEVIGRLNPAVREGREKEFQAFRERVMRGESLTGVEVQKRRKDGSPVDLTLSAAPLYDGPGQVIGIVALLADITERNRAEGALRRHYNTQTAINWILHVSLENAPLENILKQALNLILSIPWLSFESRGAIFLVEDEPHKLVMKVQRGCEQIQEVCGIVPFGKCLCGRAAAKGEIQFSNALDKRHEIHYGDIGQHGHYCVPIKHGRQVLGVINIYVKEGHQSDDREVEFLKAIANALAGVIRRSRAETALHESEKRYRTLAEAAHDVIFILDREGRVGYVNSYGAELFGLGVEELTGENITRLFTPEIHEGRRENVLKVFESGDSVYVENPLSFQDGEVWLGTWLVPLKDEKGRTGQVLGVSRDITERRRSEQEREKLIHQLRNAVDMISRSQKEWQETFDSITDMIAIVDRESTVLKANKSFAGYFGLHPRDAVNRKWPEFFHEGDAPVPGSLHRKTLEEKTAHSGEMPDRKTKRIFRMTAFPYRSPEGEIVGTIHVAHDITDEKEREVRLVMSERLAALGQMASGIAHEINNPLASIAGCSEDLLSRIRKGQCDYKLFETSLNIIQKEIFRCKSITTAVLSFVSKMTYEKKEVAIQDILDKTLQIISFQGRLKNINVVHRYGDRHLRVTANEGELRLVFLAVITNALDAMEDNGSLVLETESNGSSAVVRIIDSGPGIPPQALARVFDSFYTTKSEQGGTGLGLSIARKIIQNHKGTIEAASEPGKGTTISVSLPL